VFTIDAASKASITRRSWWCHGSRKRCGDVRVTFARRRRQAGKPARLRGIPALPRTLSI
jgi:hypothetical protein